MSNRHRALILWGCVLILAAGGRSWAGQDKKDKVPPAPGTMEAVRKQLEGRWTLLSLTMHAPQGKSAMVDAKGTLVADGFGALTVTYQMSDAGLATLKDLGIVSPNPEIATSGKVVIDVQQHRITYVGEDFNKRLLDPDLAKRRANPFALERTRYYVFEPSGELVLTTRYDDGKDANVSRWKKQ
jgi:hypothetical protein